MRERFTSKRIVVTAFVLLVAAGGPAGEAHRPARVAPPPPLRTPDGESAVTYHRDVAPILQKSCHQAARVVRTVKQRPQILDPPAPTRRKREGAVP
jgi:hypothetical protein